MWITLLVMALAVSLERFRVGMTVLLLNKPRPMRVGCVVVLAGGLLAMAAVRVPSREPAGLR